jgi:hypothetical protein
VGLTMIFATKWKMGADSGSQCLGTKIDLKLAIQNAISELQNTAREASYRNQSQFAFCLETIR